MWKGAETAIAADDRGNSLSKLLRVGRIPVQLHVVVSVGIDESRAYHRTSGDDLLMGSTDSSHLGYAVTFDADVAFEGSATVAVDNETIANGEIKHGSRDG